MLAGLLVASRATHRDTRLMAADAAAGEVHAVDPGAEVPEVTGQVLRVYRHPRPEGLA